MDLNHSFRFSFFDKGFPKEGGAERETLLYLTYSETVRFITKHGIVFYQSSSGNAILLLQNILKEKGIACG